MSRRLSASLIAALAWSSVAAAAPVEPPLAPAADTASDDGVPGTWLNGAAGFAAGVKEHRESNRPLLIYVYTDWCPYCRKFNMSVLPDPRVQQCLAGFTRVKFNPEWGPRELDLAKQMRVSGYPTLVVRNRDDIMLRPLDTMVKADKFLQLCRAELEKAPR